MRSVSEGVRKPCLGSSRRSRVVRAEKPLRRKKRALRSDVLVGRELRKNEPEWVSMMADELSCP